MRHKLTNSIFVRYGGWVWMSFYFGEGTDIVKHIPTP